MSNQKAFETALIEFRKNNPAASIENYMRGWNNGVPQNKKVKIPVVSWDKPQSVRKKLTESIVKSIRRDFKQGVTQSELCDKYELHAGTVSGVVNYKTWKNVK